MLDKIEKYGDAALAYVMAFAAGFLFCMVVNGL